MKEQKVTTQKVVDEKASTEVNGKTNDKKPESTKTEEKKAKPLSFESLLADTIAPQKPKKVKTKHPQAIVYIKSTYNNTILTAASRASAGKLVFAWSSAGSSGFKGTRKSTPHAAKAAAIQLSNKMQNYGVETIAVVFKGINPARDLVVKTLRNHGYVVEEIRETTSIGHNGCKEPRARRV